MNREIKFRFWTGTNMRYRFDGWGEHVCINEMFKECDGAFDYKVMQYTGLKDKNGKEIYEGDIVNLHDWGIHTSDNVIATAKIVWSDEFSKFDFEVIEGDYIQDEYDRFRQSPLIIGNVYENPELLKQ